MLRRLEIRIIHNQERCVVVARENNDGFAYCYTYIVREENLGNEVDGDFDTGTGHTEIVTGNGDNDEMSKKVAWNMAVAHAERLAKDFND